MKKQHSYRIVWLFLVSMANYYGTQATASPGHRKQSLQLRSGSGSNINHSCMLKCDDQPTKLVCGDDGITYKNRCQLHQAVCDGQNVKFQYRGECSSSQQRCHEHRLQALKQSNETGIPVFVPVCRDDGSYVEVQCFYGTGYCWCVNDEGKPVPGTSIQYERPSCRQRDKRKRSRRGKKKPGKQGRQSSKKASRKACTQADRSEFNTHVADLIMGEFRSIHGQVPEGTIQSHKKEMVEWKFDQMDNNRDGILKRKEFKNFRQTVKRLARNKVCGRNFWKYCDMKSDGRMTKGEWTSCLGLDSNISFKLFMSLNSQEDQNRKKKKKKGKSSRIEPHTFEGNHWHEAISPLDSPALNTDASSGPAQDCRTAHQSAIESTRSGVPNAFIPECDANDNYKPVQCYKASGWCWCVNPTNGAHIQGTSIQNDRPNCESITSSIAFNTFDVNTREWKKCPKEERQQFRVYLMDFMTNVMNHARNMSMPMLSNPDLSLEQKVAKWHFYQMDANKDGEISRKELRPLRRKITEFRNLRRCGKRIQLHCDPDSSTSITETEWSNCVLEPKDAALDRLPAMKAGNRRGPNPLETWLKADK